MLAEDRLNAIVSMVQQAGSVTVPELAEALGVTASTIQRDLQTLDRAHRIAKVHGGATSLERAHVTRDLTLNERSDLHNDDKERICARAAALVEPERFVYIDSGSTTHRLIEHFPHLEDVTYVTDSVLHAQRLALRGMRTVVLGGELKPETEALVGPDALATLDRYNFNCGFWGSNGIAAEQGFTNAKKAESEDICFIPDGDYAGYIERRCGHPAAPGDIVWRDGSVVGRHNGALRYTIGQRKGLGVAMAHPVYVTGVDADSSTVHLGEAEDLTATALTANDWIWSAPADRMKAELTSGGIA